MTANDTTDDDGKESIDTVSGHAGNLNGNPDVWVPQEVCEALSIEIGDEVTFEISGDCAIMSRGEMNALDYDPDEFGEVEDSEPTPAPTVETREVPSAGGRTETEAVVRVELPVDVVDEIREKHGELDPDAVSDRIAVAPYVDDDPV